MQIILIIVFIAMARCDISYDNEFFNQNFGFLYAKNVITGPRCIPLKSKSILANPYHPSLLSRKGGEIRRGLGIPQILNQNPLSCPADSPNDCTFNIDKVFVTSVSNSYSVNLGNSKSFSKSIGAANTIEKIDSFAKSISNSAEQVASKSIAQTNDESISEQITNAFSTAHEKATGVIISNEKEVTETDSVSQDSMTSKTLSE